MNSPNALAGNEISKCDTSSADYQSEVAGLVDGVGSEDRDSRTDPYTRYTSSGK